MSALRIPAMVQESLADLRRLWPQLLVADLLTRAVAAVVLVPLAGLLVRVFLSFTADGVLTDAGIAAFALHPLGFLAMWVVSAVFAGILFAEQGVLMVLGFAHLEGRRVSCVGAMRSVSRRAAPLVRLAAHILLRLCLLAAPFLAGIGILYLLLLRDYDINYYLSVRPPAFRWALGLSGILGAVMLWLLLRRAALWLLALPLVLFTPCTSREALVASVRAASPLAGRLAWMLLAWILVVSVLSTLTSGLVGFVGSLLIPQIDGSLVWVAAGLALTLLLAGVGSLLVQMLGTVLFALTTVRLFRLLAGPGKLDPALGASDSDAEQVGLAGTGRRIVLASIAALLLVPTCAYLVARGGGPEQRPQIIAHRGASQAAPENTMAAFQRAITEGADWIELDVQEDADGTVIVAHDSDFMKVARDRTKVWEFTVEKRRDLDIGSWFNPQYSDQRVPSLREALELARGETGVVIELKYYGHDRSLEARVVELVEELQMQDSVQIMSLKLGGVRKAAKLRPDWTVGLLNTASVGDLTRLDVDFLALNAAAASRSLIRRAQGRGMKVYVWTINDPAQMSVMLSRGADGLITDRPALAREVLEDREDLGSLGQLIVWIAGEAGLLPGMEASSDAEDA